MANSYSLDDLLEFLDHAGDRGMVPAATATALAVASRSVLSSLSDDEKHDLASQDLEAVIRGFQKKRAGEFSPSTLKEYGRRLRKAVSLYQSWREDPANFSVATRNTNAGKGRADGGTIGVREGEGMVPGMTDLSQGGGMRHAAYEAVAQPATPGTYSTAVPIRPGVVVTLMNVPHDLTSAEAERLADFVRLLAVEP